MASIPHQLIHSNFTFSFQNDKALAKCRTLFKLDYNMREYTNEDGILSNNYPQMLLIPEYENQSSTVPIPNSSTDSSSASNQSRAQRETIYEHQYNFFKIHDGILKARPARSRRRIPVPVILYKNKYVCRSSTLSGGTEMLYTDCFQKSEPTNAAAELGMYI